METISESSADVIADNDESESIGIAEKSGWLSLYHVLSWGLSMFLMESNPRIDLQGDSRPAGMLFLSGIAFLAWSGLFAQHYAWINESINAGSDVLAIMIVLTTATSLWSNEPERLAAKAAKRGEIICVQMSSRRLIVGRLSLLIAAMSFWFFAMITVLALDTFLFGHTPFLVAATRVLEYLTVMLFITGISREVEHYVSMVIIIKDRARTQAVTNVVSTLLVALMTLPLMIHIFKL